MRTKRDTLKKILSVLRLQSPHRSGIMPAHGSYKPWSFLSLCPQSKQTDPRWKRRPLLFPLSRANTD
jgi:hypothetical protein